MCVALCLVTLSESVFWGWWSLSLLPHLCYFGTFFLPIRKYCSPVWGSAADCYLQLPEHQVCSVARLSLIRDSFHYVIDFKLLDFMLLDCVSGLYVAGLYVAGLCCWTVFWTLCRWTVLPDFMLLDCVWCARLGWTRIIDGSVNFHLLPPEWDFLHESSKCQDVNIKICKVFPAGRLCLMTFPSNDLRFTVFDTRRLD